MNRDLPRRTGQRWEPTRAPMAGAKTEGRADGNHRAAAHLPLRDWHQSDKSIGTKSRVLIQYFILFTHRFWRRALFFISVHKRFPILNY